MDLEERVKELENRVEELENIIANMYTPDFIEETKL